MQTIGEALKEGLKRKGFNWQRAGEQCGINPNSLRSWVSQNKFPEAGLMLIAELAGLPSKVGELQKRFSFCIASTTRRTIWQNAALEQLKGATNPLEVFMVFDRVIERLALLSDTPNEVRSLLGSMGKGDIYAYWSATKLPFEFGEPKMAAAVARAISRGAHFLYPRPAPSVVHMWKESGLVNWLSENYFDRVYELFKSNLLGVGLNEQTIKTQVHVVRNVECHAFLIPENRFMLFAPAGTDSSRYRLLGEYPVGSRKREVSLFVPMSQEVAHQFWIMLLAGFQQDEEVIRLLYEP